MNGPSGAALRVHWVMLEATDSVSEDWRAALSSEERRRLASIRHDTARTNFIGGRALLRAGFSALYGLRDASIHVDARGKPRLCDSSVSFSLSHTRGGIVAVFAKCAELGVDIESHDRLVDHEGVARRVFVETERDWIRGGALAHRFAVLWTLKESHLKARGTGFGLDPQSFAFGWEGRAPQLVWTREHLGGAWLHHTLQRGRWRIGLTVHDRSLSRGVELRRYDAKQLLDHLPVR